MISGCAEHANEYSVYAVDSRQLLAVLNNEPRFLSITPDTGLVDLQNPRTDGAVRALALHEIDRQEKKDFDFVALPIVVSTWYNAASYVPSPPIATLSGNDSDNDDIVIQVTNFHESLALWAGVNDKDRTCRSKSSIGDDNKDENKDMDCKEAQGRYWNGIRKAVREAEANRDGILQQASGAGPPFECKKKARLGTGPDTARINYPFGGTELVHLFLELGYELDVAAGTLRALPTDDGDNTNDEL